MRTIDCLKAQVRTNGHVRMGTNFYLADMKPRESRLLDIPQRMVKCQKTMCDLPQFFPFRLYHNVSDT